jgi:hypothetical protein
MKHFALAFLIAVMGCKKSNDAGGAGSAGSSVTGSATGSAGSATGSAGSATGSAGSAAGSGSAGSGSAAQAAPFDDKLTMPNQPKRSKDEQARVDGAADALRTALTAAKTAKDSAELCKAFDPLGKAMNNLQKVSAPKGVDQQAFSSDRDGLLQLFDGASNWCDTPANVGLDTLRDVMSKIRTRFVDFVGRGAK